MHITIQAPSHCKIKAKILALDRYCLLLPHGGTMADLLWAGQTDVASLPSLAYDTFATGGLNDKLYCRHNI